MTDATDLPSDWVITPEGRYVRVADDLILGIGCARDGEVKQRRCDLMCGCAAIVGDADRDPHVTSDDKAITQAAEWDRIVDRAWESTTKAFEHFGNRPTITNLKTLIAAAEGYAENWLERQVRRVG